MPFQCHDCNYTIERLYAIVSDILEIGFLKFMIISCPVCERKFQVDDNIFSGAEERKVRCAGCSHIWLEKMPSALLVVSPPHTKREADKNVHIQTLDPQDKSKTNSLGWLLFLIVLVLAIPSFMILTRQHIVRLFPGVETLYTYAGIPTITIDTQFKFSDTAWHVTTINDVPILKVHGKIIYQPTTETARRLPEIQVSVYGKSTCEKQGYISTILEGKDPYRAKGLCIVDRWTFMIHDTLALPGEEVPFSSEKIYDPAAGSPENIVLDFVPLRSKL